MFGAGGKFSHTDTEHNGNDGKALHHKLHVLPLATMLFVFIYSFFHALMHSTLPHCFAFVFLFFAVLFSSCYCPCWQAFMLNRRTGRHCHRRPLSKCKSVAFCIVFLFPLRLALVLWGARQPHSRGRPNTMQHNACISSPGNNTSARAVVNCGCSPSTDYFSYIVFVRSGSQRNCSSASFYTSSVENTAENMYLCGEPTKKMLSL